MEQNSHHRNKLLIQIREAYGRVVYTYTAHLKKADILLNKNVVIKYLQIGLSAVSTGGFLGAIISSSIVLTYIGGLFSTALLALNLFFKEFNLLDEIKQHSNSANELWLIREDYISLLTDFNILDEKQIINKRDDLKNRVFKVYSTSPNTDKKSYKKAQNALQSEEEQFFTNDEINKILPLHLRRK